MIISIIPKDQLDKLWPFAEPLITSAWSKAPGYYLSSDIYQRIMDDVEVLWGVFDEGFDLIGVFTTVIEQYPQSRRMCLSALAGGRAKEWVLDAVDILKRYAVDHQCNFVETRGREGWRGFKGLDGWKPIFSTYVYDLNRS